jgi:hypothetical protein
LSSTLKCSHDTAKCFSLRLSQKIQGDSKLLSGFYMSYNF